LHFTEFKRQSNLKQKAVVDTMEMRQALKDVRILDFTQLLQGPYATQMLGDLGADIIKVERLHTGDIFRQMTFFNSWIGDGESPCFLAWNRNKRSIALDLKSPEGKEIVLRLAADTDVVVENFRPGTLQRLGLSYADLAKINPRIIYCSATGWGKDGPYVTRPGQDLLVQGLSGVTFQTGRAGNGPVAVGTGLPDQLGALHIVYGVLAALYHREKTGVGQEIQVSLLSSTVALQMQEFMTVLNLGRDFERPNSGIGHSGSSAPFGIYATQDGFISIAMNPWPVLVEVLGAPELIRYNDPQILFDRRDEIWQELQSVISQKTTAAWLEIMLEHDLWVAEVKSQRDVPDDPQVRHLGLFTTMDHPRAGQIRTVNMPVQFSSTPGSIRRPPPLIGEHGREILQDLGYSENEIDDFLKTGVISIDYAKTTAQGDFADYSNG